MKTKNKQHIKQVCKPIDCIWECRSEYTAQGPVVQNLISTNPELTLNKTDRVNTGLALIGLSCSFWVNNFLATEEVMRPFRPSCHHADKACSRVCFSINLTWSSINDHWRKFIALLRLQPYLLFGIAAIDYLLLSISRKSISLLWAVLFLKADIME